MDNRTPYVAPVLDPQLDVVVLRCPDQIRFDPAPLQRLIASKSKAEAEGIVCHVMEDLATRLDVLQKGLAAQNLAMMLKPCSKIRLIADQIGLTEVVIAANHVQTCLCQADTIALEATMARLERAFDVAVNEVWNFRQT